MFVNHSQTDEKSSGVMPTSAYRSFQGEDQGIFPLRYARIVPPALTNLFEPFGAVQSGSHLIRAPNLENEPLHAIAERLTEEVA